ncbi:MAG: transposase [Patescibacteria group bacterium]|nr:transposase [Patescibacteria group bacterium]
MKYKQQKQYRHKNYDYSQNGFYFVTICTKNHQKYFGSIIKSGDEHNLIYEMKLSEIGKIAKQCWLEIPKHFPFVNLDEYIIMPNHLHGIIEIDKRICNGRNEALPRSYNGKYLQMSKISPKPGSVSTIIGSFKSIVTKTVNQKFSDNNFIWQPRFYDRIIRNEKELDVIRRYICENSAKWHLDKYNLDK